MTKNQVRKYLKACILYHHAKKLDDYRGEKKYSLIIESYEEILLAEKATIPNEKHLNNIFDVADDIAFFLVKENTLWVAEKDFDNLFSRLCYEVYAMELDSDYKYSSVELYNAIKYDQLSRQKDVV